MSDIITRFCSLLIHGYNWDHSKDDVQGTQYALWRQFVPSPARGFLWNSAPSWWDAWAHERVHPYHRAWDLAEKAGEEVAHYLWQTKNPHVVICHSLGSRVVIQALTQCIWKCPSLRAVLIFNGAEASRNARVAAFVYPEVKFYNVVVKSDDVLRLAGGLFTPGKVYEPVIGYHGLSNPPPNWRNIDLGTAGDNPDSMRDHWWSFRNPANHSRWRELLADTLT